MLVILAWEAACATTVLLSVACWTLELRTDVSTWFSRDLQRLSWGILLPLPYACFSVVHMCALFRMSRECAYPTWRDHHN